jgi:hypothetical protein
VLADGLVGGAVGCLQQGQMVHAAAAAQVVQQDVGQGEEARVHGVGMIDGCLDRAILDACRCLAGDL